MYGTDTPNTGKTINLSNPNMVDPYFSDSIRELQKYQNLTRIALFSKTFAALGLLMSSSPVEVQASLFTTVALTCFATGSFFIKAERELIKLQNSSLPDELSQSIGENANMFNKGITMNIVGNVCLLAPVILNIINPPISNLIQGVAIVAGAALLGLGSVANPWMINRHNRENIQPYLSPSDE